MIGMNNFQKPTNCEDCNVDSAEFFCGLSPATLKLFRSIKITNTYPKGARLFVEGQPSERVYMLCRGRVKLTAHSRNGKALILSVAVPGELLGLSAAVSRIPYETTAEALETCDVTFVRRDEFFRFLAENADAGMNAIEQLSRQYNAAHAQIRAMGLSTCVADKFAKLLLEWSKNGRQNNGGIHIRVGFSHEEIGEMIGTSRETVTRTLKDFRERGLIQVRGSDIYVPDPRRLRKPLGPEGGAACGRL